MTQETVRQLQLNIERSKKIAELEKALVRLESNRDFKLLIAEGYLRDEAVRLVHVKADPAFQTPERQAAITKDIDSIGGLLQYFRTVTFNARIAENAISADEATIEELAAEELSQ